MAILFMYLLNVCRFSGFLEVDLEEGLAVGIDGLAGVPAVVLNVQRRDDQVTSRTMTDNLQIEELESYGLLPHPISSSILSTELRWPLI